MITFTFKLTTGYFKGYILLPASCVTLNLIMSLYPLVKFVLVDVFMLIKIFLFLVEAPPIIFKY